MTEQFIEKAKLKHGDKYDYSKVKYINAKEKVIIICKEHGEFLQNSYNHLSGKGCKKCGILSRANIKKSNIEEFINKAKLKHNDKYDYSKVEYINARTKITIICKEHGNFLQIPDSHIRGSGCSKCGRILTINGKTSNTEDFIKKSKIIHGDVYNYSKVKYNKAIINVIIICQKHGEFLQTPNSHLNGAGCHICGGSKKSNTKEFIEKAKEIHQNKYDYSKVEYINTDTKIIIICKEHGEFLQTPNSHLRGCGCIICGGHKKKTTEEFIVKAQQIHNNKYDYSKVNYINKDMYVNIICKIHYNFLQTPHSHLHGSGCPSCINKTEGKLYDILKQIYPSLIKQFTQEWCKKKNALRFDFCIPENKIIIELDGLQHFKQVQNWLSPEEQNKNDKFKEKCANDNNYSIIRLLQEDVFNDKYNWLDELKNNIEKIKSENIIQNIYMCKNNEYDIFVNN